MTGLIAQQMLFASCLGRLLVYATEDAGIALVVGEVWRSPQEAGRLAAAGIGIPHSLHTLKLAVDLTCFRLFAGVWTPLDAGTEAEYQILGNYWKSLSPLACWGGDFTKPDPNHFSVQWNGAK